MTMLEAFENAKKEIIGVDVTITSSKEKAELHKKSTARRSKRTACTLTVTSLSTIRDLSNP